MEKLKKEKQEKLIQRIQDRLREFSKVELKDDPEALKRVASITVIFGDPTDVILQKVDELNCDIVIMGTHGKGLISHTFLGSVSERVLHRIHKPVFIIPLPKGESDITLEEI